MSGKELTEKQKQVFDYITNYTEENGFPPTREEIASCCGMKYTSGIVNHLQALERKGFIRLLKKVARGIEIIKQFGYNIPIVGEIAAGEGLLAEENIIGEWDPVGKKDVPKTTFVFKVRGESMIEASILVGDMVLVDKALKPKDGDMAAVEVDGEATLKYIYFGDGTITLKPANSTMRKRVIKVDNPTLRILGTVIAIWRELKIKHNLN